MGLGYALTEEVRFKGGEVLDRNFDTYEIPRFSWVPKIEAVLIENPGVPASGCGEPPIVVHGRRGGERDLRRRRREARATPHDARAHQGHPQGIAGPRSAALKFEVCRLSSPESARRSVTFFSSATLSVLRRREGRITA